MICLHYFSLSIVASGSNLLPTSSTLQGSSLLHSFLVSFLKHRPHSGWSEVSIAVLLNQMPTALERALHAHCQMLNFSPSKLALQLFFDKTTTENWTAVSIKSLSMDFPNFCSYLLTVNSLLLLCLCTAFHCGLHVHNSICQCAQLIRNINTAIKPKLLDISVSQGVQNLNLAPATSSVIGLQLCKSSLQTSFWNISEIKGWCWNPHPNFTAVGHLSSTDIWKAVRTVL